MPGVAPSGIWTQTVHDVVVVTVQTAPGAPRTFHGLLAFAVDLGGNVRHVDFLSPGIDGSSWRITNDVI